MGTPDGKSNPDQLIMFMRLIKNNGVATFFLGKIAILCKKSTLFRKYFENGCTNFHNKKIFII